MSPLLWQGELLVNRLVSMLISVRPRELCGAVSPPFLLHYYSSHPPKWHCGQLWGINRKSETKCVVLLASVLLFQDCFQQLRRAGPCSHLSPPSRIAHGDACHRTDWLQHPHEADIERPAPCQWSHDTSRKKVISALYSSTKSQLSWKVPHTKKIYKFLHATETGLSVLSCPLFLHSFVLGINSLNTRTASASELCVNPWQSHHTRQLIPLPDVSRTTVLSLRVTTPLGVDWPFHRGHNILYIRYLHLLITVQ